MYDLNFQQSIDLIINNLGAENSVTVKSFLLGKDYPLDAVIIYISGLVNQDVADRDILKPLMFHVNENLSGKQNLADYLCKRYISVIGTDVVLDLDTAVAGVKRGEVAILVNGVSEVILIDAADVPQRAIEEPENETTIRGSREGFVESLDKNLAIIKRRVLDKSLVIEKFVVGRRSQTDGAIVYIKGVASDEIVDEIRGRIYSIDVDKIQSIGEIQQYIEDYPYSLFPQTYTTERPDVIEAELMEGKIAITVEGTPTLITAPTSFMEFFQAVGDYYERTIVSSFVRILRFLSSVIVIFLPATYLTLIRFNAELIPIKFITPIIQSRTGIALTPFSEIMAMEIIVEFLREGGLRLPQKIGQTLSVVGGIIIGDAAVRSRIVSPTTLFMVGITVVATFLIPSYDMAVSIRTLRFPMLILANMLGIFGIALGWFIILIHLFSLDSFGVPYLEFTWEDMKDIFIRAPLWKHNKRPETTPEGDTIRQTDFRKTWKKH